MVSEKWKNFWGNAVAGAAGGLILVVTNNFNLSPTAQAGSILFAFIILAFIYNAIWS